MAALEIEYTELYTSDQRACITHLVSSLGFSVMAEAESSLGNSVLLRQGPVQLIVTEGPRARAFLDKHGDGVADIAFTCDDVAETLDQAVAAGASVAGRGPDRIGVSGFGGVWHTLLPRSAGGRLPDGWSWTSPRDGSWTSPRDGEPDAEGHIQSLDHVAVCVDGGTLEYWADFYDAGFGLSRYSSEYTELGDQGMESIVVRGGPGDVTFTLLAPDLARNPGQITAFLLRNDGPGVQHLAFGVDSITSAVKEFRDAGAEFLYTPASYYELLAERLPEIRPEIAELAATGVLADRDEWGYLLQLFTRSSYPRNTLFYELVQRRGARGFGSANIKALYEAVERDRLAAQ